MPSPRAVDRYGHQVSAVRAAWFLNKPNPTRAEEDEYRDKGLGTKDGFFAAMVLLRDAVAVIEGTRVLPPHLWEQAEDIVRAYDAATRPVDTTGGAG